MGNIVEEAEATSTSNNKRLSVPRWAVGVGIAIPVAVLIVAVLLIPSSGSDSIQATGKIMSVSKVAGGEVVCVRDNARIGLPVCGLSPTGSTSADPSDPGVPVGKCARIRITDHTIDLKIRHC